MTPREEAGKSLAEWASIEGPDGKPVPLDTEEAQQIVLSAFSAKVEADLKEFTEGRAS